MVSEIDPTIKELICELSRRGLSKKKIAERTGVSESTVKRTLKKGKSDEDGSITEPPPSESRTLARDDNRGSPLTPSLNQSIEPPQSINPNLTQENTSNEIIAYVQFFRSRAKRLPYPDLSDHDKVWAETNYGKRWAEGIHMMINATGLSAEALMSAIDDCEMDVTAALERFNSKYRG